MILALLACVPEAVESGTDSADTDVDADTDADPDELAEDDARVSALTDLPEGDSPCAEPVLARVLDAVDGDTFHALPVGEERYYSVRIIGVDTPEIEHDDPAECFGEEAFAWTASQLNGRLVWLTFDAECYDIYDRTLAYVFRDTDEAGFIDRALVRNGYATTLTIAPNDTYADLFSADQREARDEGAGLWSACDR